MDNKKNEPNEAIALQPSNNRLALLKKIFLVRVSLGAIIKSKPNDFTKSYYFDINALLDHVDFALCEHNLLLTQPVRDGKVYSIITDLDTGEEEISFIDLPMGVAPQNVGGAITYFRRYTLQAALAIQADDDDANKASGKFSNQQQPQNNSDQPKKEWLNPGTEKWLKAADLLRTGKKSMTGIKKFYNISKPNEGKLIEESKKIVE